MTLGSVHEKLIAEFPRLSAKITPADQGSEEGLRSFKCLNLTNNTKGMAQLLVFWLYRRTLPVIGQCDRDAIDLDYKPILKLYLMAEDCRMIEFKEAIMARIKDITDRQEHFLRPCDIDLIYNKTHGKHPLRRLAVNNMIEYSNPLTPTNELVEKSGSINVTFLNDCWNEFKSRLEAANRATEPLPTRAVDMQ